MNISILGLPGSGKGTQADILAQKLGMFHLSTGELAREWAKKDPRINSIVQSGGLVPEEEMTNYMSEYLEKNVPQTDGILFEGYPRFINQYDYLKKWLEEKGGKINYVIFLDISEEEVIKRLSTRRTCEKCERIYNIVTNPPPSPNTCECGGKLYQRSDDNPESIRTRFKYYRDNVQPLIEHLTEEGVLVKIDGSKPIEDVTKEILGKIGQNG